MRSGYLFTHIWFSEKISAMCSFSHSTSFRAEKENSSTSERVICRADDLSSAIHAAEPTGTRAPRIVAMAKMGREKTRGRHGEQKDGFLVTRRRVG